MSSTLDGIRTREISPQLLKCLAEAELSLEELEKDQSPKSFAEFVHLSTPSQMEEWATHVLACGHIFGLHSPFQQKLIKLAQLVYTEATGNPALTQAQISGLISKTLK